MDKKNIAVLGLLFVLAAGLLFWNFSKEKNISQTPVNSDIILFYGEECPHCKDLEEFIKKNNIAEKVKFNYLEVWHNKSNSGIMMEKAQECGFAKDQLGVPFLYAKGRCFIGGPEVEKFFKEEAGI
ncbi:MAG: hypothetical protein ACD_15C00084G0017 [uncultured bacterium]|nr:MAG: hypothetical protein ACD_15C00084G0017 [uncultured bacterium]HCU70443.1 hypothetical protein [Candidatus Moranbacteria bacterium]